MHSSLDDRVGPRGCSSQRSDWRVSVYLRCPSPLDHLVGLLCEALCAHGHHVGGDTSRLRKQRRWSYAAYPYPSGTLARPRAAVSRPPAHLRDTRRLMQGGSSWNAHTPMTHGGVDAEPAA
jgi:hypothetical protein